MKRGDWEALRRRFDFRCGYCGLSETDKGGTLSLDHFQPQSRGGSDDLTNWVYACRICNEFKSAYWPADETQRLLHPLRDDLAPHLRLGSDGVLLALTLRGETHLNQLQLNRPALVAHRLAKQENERERERQARIIRELQLALKEYEDLKARLEGQ